jgi:hypothetical protein
MGGWPRLKAEGFRRIGGAVSGFVKEGTHPYQTHPAYPETALQLPV